MDMEFRFRPFKFFVFIQSNIRKLQLKINNFSSKTLLAAPILCLGCVASFAVQAEPKVITFIDVSDLHAYLTPHLDLVRSESGVVTTEMRGGIARIATAIKTIKAQNPNSNVVMNIGDTYHGGVEAFFTNGEAIAAPVNALGIDIGVPGNWDFGYGSDVTRARYQPGLIEAGITKPNFINLGANLVNDDAEDGDTSFEEGSEFLPATHMMQINGVQVGFIGITSDIVPAMFQLLSKSFVFLQTEDKYRELVNQKAAQLRAAGAAIVVVMSELGVHKDLRLGEVINAGAVDVFFSAHTHELIRVPIQTASGAVVVEDGDDTNVGKMNITIDNGNIINKTWEIFDLNESVALDPAMTLLVEAARAPFLADNVSMTASQGLGGSQKLTQPIDTVVGITKTPLSRRNALENTFSNAWTKVYKDVMGVDVARVSGFRFGAVIPAQGEQIDSETNAIASGEMTLEDIYRFFPFFHPLFQGEVTGAQLKRALEAGLNATFSKDVFVQEHGWMEGIAGVDLTLNLANADGSRITEMRLTDTGAVIGDNQILTIAGSGHLKTGEATNVTPITDPTSNGSKKNTWDAVSMFIYGIQHGFVEGITAPRTSILDQNHTPMWPESAFIQPLYGVGSVVQTPPDADADGVADATDNCPATANTDQSDVDQDGLGDVCDTSKSRGGRSGGGSGGGGRGR